MVCVMPIPGFPGFRATLDGAIQSAWKRVGPPSWWAISDEWYDRKTRVNNSSGYEEVGGRNEAGKQEWRTVHSLVCLAWHGHPATGMECAHCDGNRLNNALDNPKYKTASDNALDRYTHGTMVHSEKPVTLKLFLSQIRRIEAAR